MSVASPLHGRRRTPKGDTHLGSVLKVEMAIVDAQSKGVSIDE
jgi:hypothetical protein